MSPATCPNYLDFIRCNKFSFHVFFKEDTDLLSLPWVANHFPTVSPYVLLTIGLVSFLSSIILPTMETTDIAGQARSIYSKIRLHCRQIAVFFFFLIIVLICYVPVCLGMFPFPDFCNARHIQTWRDASGSELEVPDFWIQLSCGLLSNDSSVNKEG